MKLPKWVAIVLIASLLLNIKATLDISSMKSEIRNLQINISSINSSLDNTISSGIDRIERTIEKEGSIVSEFKYENLGIKDKKVDFILSVKPKVYNEGEKLYFLIKAGNNSPQLIPAETEDNVSFTANATISIFDEANVDLVIEGESNKKTEKLDTIYPIADKYAARINARSLGGSIKRNAGSSKLIINHEYELINPKPDGDGTRIKEANLDIELNGKVIDTFPMKLENTSKRERFYLLLKDYELQCNTGDEIIIYITAKDDMGLNYKCHMEGWIVEENGGLDHSPGRYNFRNVEVY
ncbi:hypothetical protein [Lutispora thermophila]|uniref:Uncharacterized protein n=1 Tax=Lutispora thermophila DSM 19022 TaxID=1122184 RepID=A0A1M6BRL6_9FIRM|nr:hypothetical protein [Lutispora thermophila]SHI51372.1 hypothetical protein SAMN02745176_00502 [Lutispora thermophila DSM 19022]